MSVPGSGWFHDFFILSVVDLYTWIVCIRVCSLTLFTGGHGWGKSLIIDGFHDEFFVNYCFDISLCLCGL